MIKNLNEEELKERVEQFRNSDIFGLSLYLHNDLIQKWIETKRFLTLKKELQVYNNVEFGCYKTISGCQYYFFMKSKDARDRIESFIAYVSDNTEYLPITKVSGYRNTYNIGCTQDNLQYNACPLF